MEQRTRYQNMILIILTAITAVFGALLVYNRTQPGIKFRDAFLKQQITAEYTVYYGDSEGKDIAIYVTEKTDCTLVQILAGNRRWEYIVSSWAGKPNYYSGNRPVVISDVNGEERFRGYLTQSGNLTDEQDRLDPESFDIRVYTVYGNQDPWMNYTPSNLFVAKLALEPDLTYHGSIGLFLMMLIATLCVAVDVLFPTFWFRLEHILSVRDPEPSDFYIAMQRIGWAVWPVLLAVGFGYAAMTVL